ncbi:MFS transporter [Citricoccus muralis]|uniref:MFS transporter n=1 Tax=Citricoccus muralis TaxID=169134 RepID=A0ABY8H533_9MICC|nr:MFS transporter [Citricoccus muralis]WFP16126.1 MFS transporter [Citricoccus muralis]
MSSDRPTMTSAEHRISEPEPNTAGLVPITPGTRRRVVGATFIGNFVEWFDYAVYGYLASTIAVTFFPPGNETAQLLSAWGVFAVSFLIRPIGGFVWGWIGDRYGRKTALSWSILIMSLATLCIGLLPTYEAIGMIAPLLLLLIRVIQGFSAAGEYAGASAFLVEYAPRGKRGRYASVVPASTASGLLFGLLFVTVLTGVLGQPTISEWAWRIPFWLAGPLGIIGLYIRMRLEDTPAFAELAEKDDVVRAPWRELFVDNWRVLLQTFGAALLNAVAFYVLLSYMPNYLETQLNLSVTEANVMTSISLITYIGFIVITGGLSDRLGRKKVLLSASVTMFVLAIPAFMLLDEGFFIGTFVLVIMGATLTLNDGVLPSYLSEQFPTKIRYSGFAVSFNTANALFGGSAAFVATLLISWTGSTLAPAWMLMVAAAIAFVSVMMSKETSHQALRT